MNAKSLIVAMAIMSASLTGCQSGEKGTDSQQQTKSVVAQWAPALAPDEVKALSPDEAKAILLARSVIEKMRSGRTSPHRRFYISIQSRRKTDGMSTSSMLPPGTMESRLPARAFLLMCSLRGIGG